MRFLKSFIILACTLLFVSPLFAESTLACPDFGFPSFVVPLAGSQFGGQGSPTAFGEATLTFDTIHNTVHIQADMRGIGNPIDLKLVNNSTTLPIFYFNDSKNYILNGRIDRTMPMFKNVLEAILADPSNYTLLLTNGDYSGGALSGPLLRTDVFNGALFGGAVVGSAGAANAGGSFTAEITPNAAGTGQALHYILTPTGIGSSFTSLELHQGGGGVNGPLYLTLSNGGTLTNGSFSGSVDLTDEQVNALLRDPASVYVQVNTAALPSGATRAQLGTPQSETFFPIAGTAGGALGNQWQTDVTIFNESSTNPAAVTLELFDQGQGNATASGAMNPSHVATVTIPPRSSQTISNAVHSLFGLQTALGAIRAISDQPVITLERIYDANGSGVGNAALTAQPIRGLSRCDETTRGLITGISSAGSAGSGLALRTNVGFFNPNGLSVTVSFELRNAAGAAIGSRQLTLPAYSQYQMPLTGADGLFNPADDLSNGTLSFLASAPIFAYASVVDNRNADAHVINPVGDRMPIGE